MRSDIEQAGMRTIAVQAELCRTKRRIHGAAVIKSVVESQRPGPGILRDRIVVFEGNANGQSGDIGNRNHAVIDNISSTDNLVKR